MENKELHVSLSHNTMTLNEEIDGIQANGNTLTFNNQTPVLVNVDIDHDTSDSIHYVFNNFVKAEIIETRHNTKDSTFVRNVEVNESCKIAMLALNNTEAKLDVKDEVKVGAYSSLESAYSELSVSDVEANYHYDLSGEEANVEIKVAALSSNEEKKHIEVSLLHTAKHTYGNMNNYGVTKDAGTLVFDGVGRIVKGMAQSSSHQTSKIIVFDPKCHAQANPYLFIDEYDVKASHAAGVGKMDEEHLFYLQSRGLTKNEAMKLITYGYLMPVVDVIDNPAIKEMFEKTLTERMGD